MRLTKRLLQEIANEHLGMEIVDFMGTRLIQFRILKGCFLGFRHFIRAGTYPPPNPLQLEFLKSLRSKL